MTAQVLSLTDAQQKQLKDIKQKKWEAKKSAFEQMKSNREAFNQEIMKAVPDMTKVNELQTQLKALQSQMADSDLNSTLEMKKIMTPEQFAGLMTLKKERKLMGQEHHQSAKKCDRCKRKDAHKHGGNKGDEDSGDDAKIK